MKAHSLPQTRIEFEDRANLFILLFVHGVDKRWNGLAVPTHHVPFVCADQIAVALKVSCALAGFLQNLKFRKFWKKTISDGFRAEVLDAADFPLQESKRRTASSIEKISDDFRFIFILSF